MSTKIYDAYRVKQNVNLMKLLRTFTEFASDHVAADKLHLEVIHEVVILKAFEHYTIYNALKESKLELTDEFKKQYAIGHEVTKSYFSKKTNSMFNFFMERVFTTVGDYDQSTVTNMLIHHTIPDFRVSIGMDHEYYYLKFFANGVYSKILNEIVDKFDVLEDFHYQNQSDPPEDIPYEEYQSRSDKWDEVMGDSDNYTKMMIYDIFTVTQLRELLEKYYYTGEDIYQHLAYKFDNFDIIKDPNRKIVSLDEYRTPGVKVFSGEERGKVVAQAIADAYGDNITIEIPDDVMSISHTFTRGFNSILPDKLNWESELEQRMLNPNKK